MPSDNEIKKMPPSEKISTKKYGVFSNFRFVYGSHLRFGKRYVITSLAASPMRAVSSVVAAFLPKIVLDCIENRTPAGIMILKISLAALLGLAVNLGCAVLERSCIRDRAISENELYQTMLFRKIADMDYNSFVHNETRVMKEKANQALKGWAGNVVTYIPHTCTLFASLFGFASFTAIIAKCNILFIPVLIVSYSLSIIGWALLQKYRDKQKPKWSAVFLKLGYMTFRSKDFSNAKDIRVYGMADFLQRKTEKHILESLEFEKKIQNGHFINVMFEDFLKFAISLGAYAYLIYMKLNSDMTLGDFSLYFGAITGFGTWLGKLADSIADVLECDHSVNDFRSFLDMPDKMKKTGGAPLPDKKDLPPKIELRDLTFFYDGAAKPTIDDFNLTIEPGERIAVVGVNGAGKSTLVKLICGLYIAQKGAVLLNGVDSRDYSRDEYYTLFSTVFQDVSLIPSTIAKNIALCEEEKIDRQRLWNCMRLAGIDEKVKSLPNRENELLVQEVNDGATSFSGGEFQRLLLARAVYKDAPVIILDEPTAALDPIAENKMYLRYNELTEGKTAIYISHRLSSTRFCDRIILLDDNKIAETGTHDELMALGGKYAEMFEIQSRYYRDGEAEI